MKKTLSLIVVTLCFLLSGINTNAQGRPIDQIIIPQQGSDAYGNFQKGDKDTARENKMIIIKKRLEDRNKDLLDIQKELKDLQPLDQFNIPQVPPIPGQQDWKFFGYQGFNVGHKDIFELRLKKSFNGESAETTKTFSISPDYNSLNFNLSGQVKSGVISVILIKPNGKKFKSIEIDPTSDVSFAQGIDLKKDSKEWVGDWQINIRAKKADGNYLLTIQTR